MGKGSVSQFLKEKQIVQENAMYAATKTLLDENGEPLRWEIRPLTTKEQDAIRDECTKDIPIPGKRGAYRQKTDTSLLNAKMITASVVFPDLNNKELQDSYGVMNPEDLIREMIRLPGEYADFTVFVSKFSGFTDFEDEVDDAKNG